MIPHYQPSPPVNVDHVFHALADGTRRAIVETLAQKPQSVTYLAGTLGVSLTAVGQHLQVLKRGGLVRTEKQGRTRVCQLDTAGFSALEKWARDQRILWEKRLDRLGKVLDEQAKR